MLISTTSAAAAGGWESSPRDTRSPSPLPSPRRQKSAHAPPPAPAASSRPPAATRASAERREGFASQIVCDEPDAGADAGLRVQPLSSPLAAGFPVAGDENVPEPGGGPT